MRASATCLTFAQSARKDLKSIKWENDSRYVKKDFKPSIERNKNSKI